MKKALLCMIVVSLAPFTGARGQAKDVSKERPWEYWGKPEVYLDNQREVLFDIVDKTLRQNGPSASPAAERQLALASLDALVHDTRNDGSDALLEFIQRRVSYAGVALGKKPSKGLEIIKLYNDGFIVRAGSGDIVGFDICGTRNGVKYIPEGLMKELLGYCHALFVSHKDPDHADPSVIAMASEMGIPVYAPYDFDNDRVIKMRHDVKDGNYSELVPPSSSTSHLTIWPLPGHQDGMENNIWVITFPNGYSVAHCGDQYRKEDLEWLRTIGTRMKTRIDVLIIDSWAMSLKETIEGFNPRCVISGHENEMGHTIDHREALWLSQYKFDEMGLQVPCIVMAWGERFLYKKKNKDR